VTNTESPVSFAHWMLREIHEQPETLAATLALYADSNGFRKEVVAPVRAWLARHTHLVFAASGSSRHASLTAEVRIEELSPLAVDVEYASEAIYSASQPHTRAGVVVVSQSGETADTLEALRQAKDRGRSTLAITNVHGSTMSREADVALDTAAGVERAIPATKSFTAQLLVLEVLALLAAEAHGTLSPEELAKHLDNLHELPARIAAQLDDWQQQMERVAKQLAGSANFLFLGRAMHYAIAREGALKLKESAYCPAEGYPSGELKHGPNALVSADTPLVMIATRDADDVHSLRRYDRVVQLMREMRTQGATIVAIANRGDVVVASIAHTTIEIDAGTEPVNAISEVIPLQMFAYFTAVERGVDVDRPRNLVKAVIAE
jgi:glucosamine--fructose-6-phosphate aminotransferase (isomerizing)